MSEIIKMSEEYVDYCRDESRSVGYAETISFPKTEEDVREILKSLADSDCKITIQGNRTGLAAGAVPYGGHILNTCKMDKILGMRQENEKYYLRVQPGILLLNLRKAIADKTFDTSGWDEESLAAYEAFQKDVPYFWPTDPTETSAAIGGIVACNASGAKSFRYGPARPHVNALRLLFVDGDLLTVKRGDVKADGLKLCFTTGSGKEYQVDLPGYTMPNCKNASGYYVTPDMDLLDLFIGSDGTLGVFTEIELELLKLPEVIWGTQCFFESEDQAVGFTEAVRGNIPNISAMEFFDAPALDILRNRKATGGSSYASLPDMEERINNSIYVEIEAYTEEDAEESLMMVAETMMECGGKEEDTWIADTPAEREKQKFFRHVVPEGTNMIIDERRKTEPSITKLGADMAVEDKYLLDVLKMYRESIKEEGFQSASWGHIGNNHLHVNLIPRNKEEYLRGKELFKRWAAEVTRMGGAVSAEHGVGKLKRDFLTIMYGEEHIKEMARMKKTFDPFFRLGCGNMFVPEVLDN